MWFHNHYILNAVSFVDGKKYCNYKSDYEALRNMSDAVCREYQLSVLENAPIHTPGSKNEVWIHKAGKLTHRDMLKRDIEFCPNHSESSKQFENHLKGLGYTLDVTRMSVKGKVWERSVRLKNIGFTTEIINEQLTLKGVFNLDDSCLFVEFNNNNFIIVFLSVLVFFVMKPEDK